MNKTHFYFETSKTKRLQTSQTKMLSQQLKLNFQRMIDIDEVFVQKSKEWLEARKGYISASNAASLLYCDKDTLKPWVDFCNIKNYKYSAKRGANSYQSKSKFILDKLGRGPPFKGNCFTQHGVCLEDVIIRMFELRNDDKIREFTLTRHKTIPFLAVSVDGCSEKTNRLIEIKAPFKREIVHGQ